MRTSPPTLPTNRSSRSRFTRAFAFGFGSSFAHRTLNTVSVRSPDKHCRCIASFANSAELRCEYRTNAIDLLMMTLTKAMGPNAEKSLPTRAAIASALLSLLASSTPPR